MYVCKPSPKQYLLLTKKFLCFHTFKQLAAGLDSVIIVLALFCVIHGIIFSFSEFFFFLFSSSSTLLMMITICCRCCYYFDAGDVFQLMFVDDDDDVGVEHLC